MPKYFTPTISPLPRRRSLLPRFAIAACIVIWCAGTWLGINSIAATWHAASSIGRPAQTGGR